MRPSPIFPHMMLLGGEEIIPLANITLTSSTLSVPFHLIILTLVYSQYLQVNQQWRERPLLIL